MKKTAFVIIFLVLSSAFLFSSEIGLDRFNDQFLLSLDKPTIITFGEDWCSPCLKMIPYLNKLAETNDRINVYYVDLEKVPEALEYIPISATPTTAFYMPGGIPFMPKNTSNYQLYSYSDTGEHALTLRVGLLSLTVLRQTAKEMLND